MPYCAGLSSLGYAALATALLRYCCSMRLVTSGVAYQRLDIAGSVVQTATANLAECARFSSGLPWGIASSRASMDAHRLLTWGSLVSPKWCEALASLHPCCSGAAVLALSSSYRLERPDASMRADSIEGHSAMREELRIQRAHRKRCAFRRQCL